ncbi:MAG: formate dehydrogenase accessory sulfurtransferase FdhD [Flavobacteriaceae bacterium]|nr:formate dehydrogenase accessory sulfurtransferase FdhD [Flavobacteriaceae bacterium]
MQTIQYQGIQFKNNNNQLKNDDLLVEAALQININNKAYTVVMRTPGNDFELVRGLLFAEDIYKEDSTLDIEVLENENSIPTIINVSIAKENLGKGYLNKRTLLSVSSCGICGKTSLKDLQTSGTKIDHDKQLDVTSIFNLMNEMSSLQKCFQKTGGSHAAAAFTSQQQLLSVKEDIGRHNAVDKIVGDLLIKKKLKDASILLVSGRVSYEIVSKAFIAKIPIIVAVSACSSLAVDFAKEFGICLIGFTRQNKLTIYSNPNYVKNFEYV